MSRMLRSSFFQLPIPNQQPETSYKIPTTFIFRKEIHCTVSKALLILSQSMHWNGLVDSLYLLALPREQPL